MKKHILLTLLMAASILCSCTEYLDVKPYGRTIPKTAEEFSALLHKHLDVIDKGEANLVVPNAGTTMDWDAGGGDDFEVCLTNYSGRVMAKYLGDIVGTMAAITGYSDLYEVIRDCNIIIGNLSEGSDSLTRNVLGASYAMRAVCYYQLLRMYCPPPEKGCMGSQLGMSLVTEFDMEARIPRSSMEATVNQIESDLQKAISLHCTDNLYRFTEDVAKGYLARLYFWTEQWDKVLPLTTELLQKYPLLGRDAYKSMMESNAMGANQLIKANRNSTSDTEYSTNSALIKFRPVSKRLLSNYNLAAGEDKSDIRYSMTCNLKRKNKKLFFNGMRSAEFKLMEAECHYHLGDNDKALQSINNFRDHRVLNNVHYTMQTLPGINSMEIITVDAEGNPLTPLMAAIISERRKEMYFEGDRMFELKRNGTPEYWTSYDGLKYVNKKYMYTFPIPESEIRIVNGMEQNEGYTELVSQ